MNNSPSCYNDSESFQDIGRSGTEASTLSGPVGNTHYAQNNISKTAELNVLRKTKNSKLFLNEEKVVRRVPKFCFEELTLGPVLGRGAYCVVNEITKITLIEKALEAPSNGEEEVTMKYQCNNPDYIQDRAFMGKHFLRDIDRNNNHGRSNRKKECRYAIKKVQAECYRDASNLLNATIDLALEAKILATLGPHANIIKMRAMSNSSMYDSKKFFIVLDRLRETLNQRLVQWRKRKPRTNGIMKKILDREGKKEQAFYAERCSYACDLASALLFLHSSFIMYRDLKPENIGFDVRGDIKLFDFGLAKEFDPGKRDANGCFHLTEDTGSLRYMDPNVALGKPYNELCDVYSFCILLWQMLELETPFHGFSVNMFMKNVVQGGYRPKINRSWSVGVQEMMWSAWDVDYSSRPSMESIGITLHKEIENSLDDNILEGNGMTASKSASSLRDLERDAE